MIELTQNPQKRQLYVRLLSDSATRMDGWLENGFGQ
jgi:hypothetical protein